MLRCETDDGFYPCRSALAQQMVFITKREKAESEAHRGKPKGDVLESEIRSAIPLLGQRPPRYTGVGQLFLGGFGANVRHASQTQP